MKERPILFSSPMVLVILKGLKTQTRRTKGLDRLNEYPAAWHIISKDPWIAENRETGERVTLVCPYGQAEDRLWVRETWADMICVSSTERGKGHGEPSPKYKATADTTELEILRHAWKPSIFMPRWAARTLLELTGDPRPERLQDISPEDCEAEGVTFQHPHAYDFDSGNRMPKANSDNWLKIAYMELWDSINGKTHPWAGNPWIWVVQFRRIQKEEDIAKRH